jgi:hypothetical protein
MTTIIRTPSGDLATYHPISQFWGMQFVETAILLAAAVLIIVLSISFFRRFTN